MIFKQYRYEPLGQTSYLIGCMRSKKGVVIDPISDLGVGHYLLEASDLGLTLAGVFDTHVHADYLSCARELASEASIPYYLHESLEGTARFDFTPVEDRMIIELGRVVIEAMHTPGHTPEHVCYVIYDRARSEAPCLVLTGDCLFVGDVGRPDLLLEDQAFNVLGEAERAESQYKSIREGLFRLPDHVEVWPGHYGGSTCGGVNMSGKASSTIYFERNFNLAINQPDAEAFARFVKETAKPFPENYRKIKASNLGLLEEDDIYGDVRGMEVEEFAAKLAEGAVAIDLRPPLTFAREHIEGAVNLQFNRADLVDRAEMVLPLGVSLIVCTDSDVTACSAVEILRDAGFVVLGFLSGGLGAWTQAGRAHTSMPVISADELHASGSGLQVIDARESYEYRYGHIAGATLLSSMEAWERVEEIPLTGNYAVVCGDQVRSALVASILQRAGRDARLVSGGMADWLERGFPVEKAS